MAVGEGRRDRWARRAGVLGVGFAVTGLSAYALWPQFPRVASVLEGAALLCFVFYVTVNAKAIRVASSGRTARLGLHSTLLVIVVVAIVGLVNTLAARHNVRWDLSGSGKFSLAPQTIKILKGLDRDVTMTLFVQDSDPSKEMLQGLAESYQHDTFRIKIVSIDPDKHPAVAKQYGITQYNTVVVESGGQSTRMRFSNQQELDNREQQFTNALIRVTRTEKKRIAFLEGHGEHRTDDVGQNGFSLVKEALEHEGYNVSSLVLAQQGQVPEKMAAIVIDGPTKTIAPQEVEILRNYLNAGGRLLVMVDPLVTSGLDALLADWGVTLDNDLVIETSSPLFGAGLEVVVASHYSTSHPITKEFTLATAFPAARSLRFDESKKGPLQSDPLITTSDKSWGETDLKNPQVSLDRLRDIAGPLQIAMAVRPGTPREDDHAPTTGPNRAARLVVFGDADFATNNFFRLLGNGDLFLNTLNWLGEQEDVISIRPKEARLSPLILNNSQEETLFLVSLVLFPGVVLLVGLGAWQWRRRL
jgi:ABC-type uncharacterized transport system involved in gliding motility auxiliary subunit